MTLRVKSAALFLAVTMIAANLIWAGPAHAESPPKPLMLQIPVATGRSQIGTRVQVGTRSLEVVDRSRPAGFGRTGPRRMMLQVTYPRKHGPCRRAEYMAPKTERVLLFDMGLNRRVWGESRTCTGGDVLWRRLPLVVFSHAYTADRSVYTTLVADLASRGYIVASVDHTSDAFAVQFPSGEVVPGVFGSPLASDPISDRQLASLINVRVADVRFVTTLLLKRSADRGGWLSGRIDPQRIGVFGHSLGGATAVRAASIDRRFRASIDIDGSLFGRWPLTTRSRKPLLLFTAQEGLGSVLAKDKACSYLRAARQPKLVWQLDGAKHLSFSDFQVLAPQIAEQDPSWQFATLYKAITGSLDPERSVLAQRTSIARFFDAYLGRAPARSRPGPPAGVSDLSARLPACTGAVS